MMSLWIALLGLSAYSSPRLTSSLLRNPSDVYTNLTVAFAQSSGNRQSSAVSLGNLPGLKLGSAGSKAGQDIGAATSFGLSRADSMEISLGVSAAQSNRLEAISRMFHRRVGSGSVDNGHHRNKRREATSAATSLTDVSGTGSVGNLGSTGVKAGPVATAVSLGSLLSQIHRSRVAFNAAATAAHAGKTDLSATFTNSNFDDDGNNSTES